MPRLGGVAVQQQVAPCRSEAAHFEAGDRIAVQLADHVSHRPMEVVHDALNHLDLRPRLSIVLAEVPRKLVDDELLKPCVGATVDRARRAPKKEFEKARTQGYGVSVWWITILRRE